MSFDEIDTNDFFEFIETQLKFGEIGLGYVDSIESNDPEIYVITLVHGNDINQLAVSDSYMEKMFLEYKSTKRDDIIEKVLS